MTDDINDLYRISEKLRDKFGHWSSHPKHPVEEWMLEVRNSETRLGYWYWVAARIELATK